MDLTERLVALNVQIFADGADLASIRELMALPYIKGFTTNPTLMRKAGIVDYRGFAKEFLAMVTDRPISFEVFADDFPTMERQALEIASWGPNANVKIPITNTRGESAVPLVARLSHAGVVCNVTAMFTLQQVHAVLAVLSPDVPAILSLFAGRIADAGIDPVPMMQAAKAMCALRPKAQLLWASPREVFNIYHAESAGADIITVSHDLLRKLPGFGKNLDAFSLETVAMFYGDAQAAGYSL
jgi:transaldolase